MRFLTYLSELLVPFVVMAIVGYGIAMKVPVYDSFLRRVGKADDMPIILW